MDIADLATHLRHTMQCDCGLDIAIGGDLRAKGNLLCTDNLHQPARHIDRDMFQRRPAPDQHKRHDECHGQ